MGSYIWLNAPLMALFLGCWAGIPLYLTLTRWNAELRAKHAEIAPAAAHAPALAQPAPALAVAPGADDVTYAGAGRGRPR
ncbi:MAG TPA: hypothetical protein VMI33_19275 [Streptosporangiaceae bacterium]|nr:hypothetical protein [Streptosporangiaceae bacterium]